MSAENGLTLAESVRVALGGLTENPKDVGAVRLAMVYAEAIDLLPTEVAKLGPGLLAVLESLGLTPRARAAILGKYRGGGDDAPARTRLDELREQRARARADGP